MGKDSDRQSFRSRSFSWENPAVGAEMAPKLAGLEYLQSIIDGKIPQPPISHTIDFYLAEVEKGRVVFSGQPAEFHYNPIGTVHGGLAATLIDSALSCAVHSMLPSGKAYTTVELKLNYLRPMSIQSGNVRCIGTIIHLGRRIATAEAQIVDVQDRLLAHGTGTCLIWDI